MLSGADLYPFIPSIANNAYPANRFPQLSQQFGELDTFPHTIGHDDQIAFVPLPCIFRQFPVMTETDERLLIKSGKGYVPTRAAVTVSQNGYMAVPSRILQFQIHAGRSIEVASCTQAEKPDE